MPWGAAPLTMLPRPFALRHPTLAALLCLPALAAGTAHAGDAAAAIDRVRQAFVGSRAQDLRPLLPPERRVYLRLPEAESGGFVGGDQAYYLLKQFFAEHPTRAAELEPEPEAEAAPGENRVARGSWRFRASGGRDRTVSLLVVLREIDGDWVLSEVRAGDS